MCLGFLVRWYKIRKVRKYTALEEARVELGEELGQMDSVTPENAQESPFGIRALEAGIEIEGVWISKSNTPASSIPSTPRASAVVESSSSQNNIHPDLPSDTNGVPFITMPPPVLGQTGLFRPKPTNYSRPSSSYLEPPRLLVDRRARTGSPTPEGGFRGRNRYRPRTHSNVGYSDPQNFGNDRNIIQAGGRDYRSNRKDEGKRYDEGAFKASTPAAIELANSNIASGEYDSHHNPEIRVHSPGNERQLIASPPANTSQPQSLHPSQHPVSVTPPDAGKSVMDGRTSLDALAAHRLSHVAETGQLGPRTRRTQTSDELTPSTPASSLTRYRRSSGKRSRPSYPGEDENSIELQARDPPARSSFEVPLINKSSDLTSEEARATSMPLMSDVDSIYFNGAQEALQYMEKTEHLMRSQERGLTNTAAESDAMTRVEHADGDIVQSESKQDVLRTVNSGFEILHPGTFDQPGQSIDTTRESVSFVKKQSKKLQKKNPKSILSSDSV